MANVIVGLGPARSDVLRARSAGPLRLLFPRAAGSAAWIVTSSLGGGLVDGDDVALEVVIGAGATSLVTTQASSKVYKGTSSQRLDLRADAGATAVLVPDPVVPYRDARFTQVTTIELASDATLLFADVLTAGRVAYGERWSAARLDSSLLISRDGVRVLNDRILLDPDHGSIAVRMRRFEALATVVLLGPRVAAAARSQLAAIGERPDAVIAGSPLADGALFRIAGEHIEVTTSIVRELMREACECVGEDPWGRKW